MNMDNGLTDKQIRFCQEYIVDLNGTQAAIRAGYSQDTAGAIASENLTKPEIINYVNIIKNERAERTKITADFVLTGLKEIAERCLQRKPVMVKVGKEWEQKTVMVDHGDGKFVSEGVWEFDSVGANKALETLAKHLKLLTDKHEVTVNPLESLRNND